MILWLILKCVKLHNPSCKCRDGFSVAEDNVCREEEAGGQPGGGVVRPRPGEGEDVEEEDPFTVAVGEPRDDT
jgi:hypothetical protein